MNSIGKTVKNSLTNTSLTKYNKQSQPFMGKNIWNQSQHTKTNFKINEASNSNQSHNPLTIDTLNNIKSFNTMKINQALKPANLNKSKTKRRV